MKDSMYYFLLGFMTMFLLVLFVASRNPEPDTKVVCQSCGAEHWWMVLAEEE
tara:strand:+ start:484 stop:639 length:156 start_codon:yes stop_codon:yes gene_type:complete